MRYRMVIPLFLLAAFILTLNTTASLALKISPFAPSSHTLPAFTPHTHTTSYPLDTPQTDLSAGESVPGWPMVAANTERTSWTAEEVRGYLRPLWYKPIQPYIAQNTQIIAAYGRLYIATAKGLYTLDAATGAEGWVYPTELPLGNSPTIENGIAYVGGHDRKLHAIDALTGQGLWTYAAEGGFETNPLVIGDKVFLGNRDGYFYAIYAVGSPNAGQLAWRYHTDGPIRYSAAHSNGVIFFASEDSYAYALNANTGALVWKSAHLPGAGFQAWWPVVYGDRVIFSGGVNYRTSIRPGLGLQIQEAELDDLYPNHSTDPKGTLIGALGTAAGSWATGTPTVNAAAILQYFNQKPWRRSIFVLNRNTGAEMETAPVLWTGSKNGTRYPPVVGADGVLYQQSNYMSDPYIAGGQIAGWEPGNGHISVVSSDWGAVDEPVAAAAGGDLVYWNLCCDRQMGAFDVTLPNTQFYDRYQQGIRPPTASVPDANREWFYVNYNIASLFPGYNTAYYMSDSSPYASFGINGVYGYHGNTNPPIPYNGRVYTHRGNSILAFSPANQTVQHLPLFDTVAVQDSSATLGVPYLQAALTAEIEQIIAAGHLRPAYTSHGIFDLRGQSSCGDDLVDYWHNTSDLILVLLEALPYLSPALQAQVETYLQTEATNYPPFQYNHNGWTGTAREPYTVPPDANMSSYLNPRSENYTFNASGGWNGEGVWGINPYAYYAVWKYAAHFGNAAMILQQSQARFWQEFNDQPSDTLLQNMPHVFNAFIAGYYGFVQLQQLAGQTPAGNVVAELNRLMALRANTFSKDSAYAQFPGPTNNIVAAYCRTLNVANNFMYLTPELALYLRNSALSEVNTAVSEYTTLAPFWFVSLAQEGFAENNVATLYDTYALFLAQAWIQDAPGTELERYVDSPAFPVGDLYYIHKLTLAIADQSYGYTMSVTPDTAMVSAGGTAVYRLQFTPTGGFASPINISLGTIPATLNVTLNVNTITPPGTVRITVTDLHPPGFTDPLEHTVQVTAVGDSIQHTISFSLLVNWHTTYLPLTRRN